MKHLSINVVASLLAIAVTVGAAPAFASVQGAQPQCGDEKKGDGKDSKGDSKDGKGGDTKPKAPSLL